MRIIFTKEAQEVLLQAQSITQEYGHNMTDTLHLLYALLLQKKSDLLIQLQRLKIDSEGLKKKVKRALDKLPTPFGLTAFRDFYPTADFVKVLQEARNEADKMGEEYVSSLHLFLALLSLKTKAQEILDKTPFLQNNGKITTKKLEYKTFLSELTNFQSEIIKLRRVNGTLIEKHSYIEGGNNRWLLSIKLRSGEIIDVIGKAEKFNQEEISEIIRSEIGKPILVEIDENKNILKFFL
jgi:ATP-dependent Clp protease ATP-binding subunit ClpA